MTVFCHLTISLDGFAAGPSQSLDDPMGRGAMGLHTWHFDADEPGHGVDAAYRDNLLSDRGAYAQRAAGDLDVEVAGRGRAFAACQPHPLPAG